MKARFGVWAGGRRRPRVRTRAALGPAPSHGVGERRKAPET